MIHRVPPSNPAKQRTLPRLLLMVAFCLMMPGMRQLASAAPAPSANLILDTAGIWRMYHTLSPPLIEEADGALKPLQFNVKWLDWETPPAPANWMAAEMNDRTWMRGPARRCARTPYLSRLCIRGKFEVANSAPAGEMSLALEYHGGVVVYLNGQEVGKGNMAPAEDGKPVRAQSYPAEAFLDAKEKLLDDSAKSGAEPLRSRSLALSIPGKLLRKGTNVLAIDVWRAPYPAILLTKKPGGVGGVSKDPGLMWNTCEIRSIKLSAPSLDGIVPNTTRPKGVQVWNGDTLVGDVDVDYADRSERLLPVAISGPRNAARYGKFIIGHDKPITGLSVKPSDLKSESGVIKATEISFLYGIPGGREIMPSNETLPAYPNGASFLNTLVPEPLKEFPVSAKNTDRSRVNGAVVPVWIRVKIPKEAKPGLYKGTLTVSMAGEPPLTVALETKVLPWALPDPQEFKTWVELIQSPDTLSVEYRVPLWSDKHFELIGRSFDLIRNTGARSLYVPLIAHTNLGNEESMVRWIKKDDGSYDWDFSVMDRYLDVAQKHLGTPKLVVLQVWEVYMNTKGNSTGRRFGEILDQNQKETGGAPLVTFIDAAGKTQNGTIPKLNDPASRKIWKDLMAQVRERFKKRGLESTLQLGLFTDSTPNKEDTKFFLDLAPGLPWVQHGHNAFSDLNGMAKVGYTATWWSQRFADDLVNQRSGTVKSATYKPHTTAMTSLFGWNRPHLDAYYPRMTNEPFPISYWLFLCETAITGDFYRGIGRVGADYWPSIKSRDGRRVGWVNERFIEVTGYLHSLHSYLLEPLPDGPATMNRLIALEEGIQDCEARIYIENAMVNKGLAKQSPELAKRCQETLDERLLYMWKSLDNMQFGGWGVTAWRFQAGVSGHAWLLNTAPQERAEKLYLLAGEVQKAIEK